MTRGGEALFDLLGKVSRNWVLPIVLGFAVLIVVQKMSGSSVAVQEGMEAPNFTLEATDGSTVTLSKLRGVPVILNFWGTWCSICVAEVPMKSRFARSHPEVAMVGIAVDSGGLDTLSVAKAELGITYPVLESNKEVEASYGVNKVPLTILVDDQGIIRQVRQGKISKQKLSLWLR